MYRKGHREEEELMELQQIQRMERERKFRAKHYEWQDYMV